MMQVSELEAVLEKEKRLNRVLHCSLQGRNVVCHCCLSALVPTKVIAVYMHVCLISSVLILKSLLWDQNNVFLLSIFFNCTVFF
jgi:hypothetical protein